MHSGRVGHTEFYMALGIGNFHHVKLLVRGLRQPPTTTTLERMNHQADLPSFERPPVNEVVLGVQFAAPSLTAVHLGLYYELVRKDYPAFQAAPPLPPIPILFGSSVPQLMGVTPRGWFSSLDDTGLIQLQSDRLVFNWKSGPDAATYPRYPSVRKAFEDAYINLSELCASEGLGSITPSVCEVYYVNPLPEKATGVATAHPERIFVPWNGKVGPEWSNHPLEDLSFTSRYTLLDRVGGSIGRLSLSVGSGQSDDGSGGFFTAQLMALGTPPRPGLQGVLEFFDIAHEAIVCCFAATTTPEMHDLWKRLT
jgi:uncharacterized protein (TIGR04255 family)